MKTGLMGTATGIGSLPYTDAEAALELVFQTVPEMPFWPQLPKRDKREGMIAQFLQGLPVIQSQGGELLPGKPLAYLSEEKRLEEFYERLINKDLDYFKITPDYAAGLYAFKEKVESRKELLERIRFIKAQITGPFTCAAGVKDENGVAYLHNPVFMQAFVKGLAMKALWQIDFFRSLGKDIMLFIDEPYLGCFGSAYTPLNRSDVVGALTELTETIKAQKALIGVHCCGNTDWSIFTEVKGIDIINFDAFGYIENFVLYAKELQGFLERDGMVCWGIVPTQEFSRQLTPEILASKIENGIAALAKKGVSRNLILQNLLISPSCGLSTLETAKAEEILGVLRETSAFIREKF